MNIKNLIKNSLFKTVVVFTLSAILFFALGYFSAGGFISETPTSAGLIRAIEPEQTSIPLPNGKTLTVPKGEKVVITYSKDTTEASTSTYKKNILGKAQGGKARGSSGLALLKSSMTPPELNLSEGNEGGTGGAIESLTEGAKSGTTVIIFAGLAFVAAGVLLMIFLKDMKNGTICIFAGGTLIGVGLLVQNYPWVLFVGLAAVVGVIGYLVYRSWKNGKLQLTLNKIVNGIEKADPDAQKEVKSKIASESTTAKEAKAVKTTVSAVKMGEV